MHTYHLAATTVALGQGPTQIIKSGRVRMCNVGGIYGGTDGQYLTVQVGIAAVDESTTSTAAATQFACVLHQCQTGALKPSFNICVPCNFRVEAGQSLMVNVVGTATVIAIEVLVLID